MPLGLGLTCWMVVLMVSEKQIKNWMESNKQDYDNATNLAEAVADEFNLYEDDIDYVIPEYVFELSAGFYDSM